MKYLFLMLILCNLAYYLWETGAGGSHAPREEPESNQFEGLERIQLVKELMQTPPKPQERNLNSPPETPVSQALPGQRSSLSEVSSRNERAETSSAETCFLVGPYSSKIQSQTALQAFGTRLGKTRIMKKPAEAVSGFWVLYPSADTPEAALVNKKMLLKKGLAGIWVIDKGKERNAVSLAIAGNKEQADEAVARYRSLGIQAEAKPRTNMADRWWLEIRGRAGRESVEARALPPSRNGGTLTLTPCD